MDLLPILNFLVGVSLITSGNAQIKQFCPENLTTLNNSQVLKWYRTPVNKMALSDNICVDSSGWVKRQCLLNTTTGEATWSPMWRMCYKRHLTPNLTGELYQAYIRSHQEPTNKLNVTNLKEIWKSDFRLIDLAILVEYFAYLPVKLSSTETTDLLHVISVILEKNFDRVSSGYKQICLEFCSIFNKLLYSINLFEDDDYLMKTSNLLLYAWRPFRNNISGIAWDQYKIKERRLHMHESIDNINLQNTSIAGYIPWAFLNDLSQSYNLSNFERNKLQIVLLLAKDSKMFTDFFKFSHSTNNIRDFAAISIPNFCKITNSTMIKLHINTTNYSGRPWVDFGQEYLDDAAYDVSNCILSKFSYFSYTNETYFESVRRKYCLSNITISTNSSTAMFWGQAPVNTRVYQKEFCADDGFRIPSLKCNNHAVLENDLGFKLECANHTTSNMTELLYHSAVTCEGDFAKILDMINPVVIASYVDVKLYFYVLVCLIDHNKNVLSDNEYWSQLINKGFDLIENSSWDFAKSSYVGNFFTYYLHSLSIDLKDWVLVTKDKYFLFIYNPFKLDVIGLVVYKSKNLLDYRIRYLRINDSNQDYSLNDQTIAVVRLTDYSLKYLQQNLSTIEKELFSITITMIFRSKFVQTKEYSCQSYVLGLTYDSVKQNISMEFDVYLKSNTEDQKLWKVFRNDKGLSSNIKANTDFLKLIFISRAKFDVCDSLNRITTYHVRKVTDSVEFLSLKRSKSVDLISKLWIFINPEAKQVYEDHYHILRIVMISGGSMSIVGISGVILTAILFKKWHRKRTYSIQLLVVIACQTIYFFRNSNDMIHIEYILFYYFTLSQFAWMLIIGYIQYLRFVKIFHTSDPGLLKPMVIGWVLPLFVTIIPIWLYKDCLHCSLCSSNGDIFIYFVIIPMSLVIFCNILVYVFVMVNISRSKCQKYGMKIARVQKRAAILLPFLLGISWIFIFAMVFPWSWVVLVGSYLFYVVIPLNGFVLFMFVVIADKSTRLLWKNKLKGIDVSRRHNSSSSRCTTKVVSI